MFFLQAAFYVGLKAGASHLNRHLELDPECTQGSFEPDNATLNFITEGLAGYVYYVKKVFLAYMSLAYTIRPNMSVGFDVTWTPHPKQFFEPSFLSNTTNTKLIAAMNYETANVSYENYNHLRAMIHITYKRTS